MKKRRNRQKKKQNRMKRRFWSTFLISLIVFSGAYALIGHYVLDDNSIALMEDEDEIIDKEIEERGELMFLLMGIDDSEGIGGVKKVKELKEDANGYKKTAMRTDTIILCKFNYETGEISMLSIPRDTRTHIRGRRNQEKVNHAYAYGGHKLTMETVSDLLGVDLEYYVTVDYEAVKEIVNAIGGVEIDVPRRMYYQDLSDSPPLVIDIQPGLQKLNGDKSIQYLRFRSYPEGDIGRVEAQQVFMMEFIKQTLQPRNITKIPKMINTYFDYVDTNIPITSMLKAVPSINDIDFANIRTERLQGDTPTIEGISYFIPYEAETRQTINEMFSNFVK